MPSLGVRARHQIRQITTITLLGAVIGGGFVGPLVGGIKLPVIVSGLIDGAVVGFLLSAFDVLFLWRPIGAPVRRSSYPVFIAVRTAYYVLVIFFGVQFSEKVVGLRDVPPEIYELQAFPVMVIALSLALGLTFFLSVERMLGPHVLRSFLLGRYHRPVEESRVFLFVDLAGSTAIAERIGDLGVHQLLSQVYFEVTDPIVENRGEIYQYVGDEIVVTWPLRVGVEEARCIRCVFEMFDCIARRAEWYRERFGLVPEFRAGLHAGPVVTGQIGDWKQELMFVGDTINTAARIQQACRQLGRKFLVSRALLSQVALPEGVCAEDLGRVQLRGKQREVELFALKEG